MRSPRIPIMRKTVIILFILSISAFAQRTYTLDVDAFCQPNENRIENMILRDQHNQRINGIVYRYYDSGELELEIPALNGRIEGTSREYDREGKITREMTVYGGNIASRKTYHNNGQLAEEWAATGTSSAYYEDGKLSRAAKHKDGKLDGEFKTYDQSGKLLIDAVYASDLPVTGRCVPDGRMLTNAEMINLKNNLPVQCN